MYGQAHAIDLVFEPNCAVRPAFGDGPMLRSSKDYPGFGEPVRVGDTVHAGQKIGSCGNSGNSSKPHVHAQLMDRESPWTAQGVPMVFGAVTFDDESENIDALPANEQHMMALPLAS